MCNRRRIYNHIRDCLEFFNRLFNRLKIFFDLRHSVGLIHHAEVGDAVILLLAQTRTSLLRHFLAHLHGIAGREAHPVAALALLDATQATTAHTYGMVRQFPLHALARGALVVARGDVHMVDVLLVGPRKARKVTGGNR